MQMSISQEHPLSHHLSSATCPECGGYLLTDHTIGEIACCSCGLIIHEQRLDQTPEYRAYTKREQQVKIRVGPSSFVFHDKGLATTFNPFYDAIGNRLPVHEQLKMRRLQKWNRRMHQHERERNFSHAMTEITRLIAALHLPTNIQENAAILYRKAYGHKLIRGRSIKGMAAAAVYAACRLTQIPTRLQNLVTMSPCRRKEIAKSYRLIHQYLNLHMPLDNSVTYVAKIASRLNLDPSTQQQAITLLNHARQKQGLVGKMPAGLAGAALYIASRMRGNAITQAQIAAAAEVTEVTIRNRFRSLDHLLDLGLRS
jgi:transcription initiation factor TFIIB